IFGIFVGFQLLIALTGNYAFFNLLTAGLCVWLLDDATLQRLRPAAAGTRVPPSRSDSLRRLAVGGVSFFIVPTSLFLFLSRLDYEMPGAALVRPLVAVVAPFRSVNTYGLFAVMTTTRPALVVEGSDDRIVWKAYAFKYQPTDVHQPIPWVAPH